MKKTALIGLLIMTAVFAAGSLLSDGGETDQESLIVGINKRRDQLESANFRLTPEAHQYQSRPGERKKIKLHLYANDTFMLNVQGDKNSDGVNIRVLDKNGKLLASNSSKDPRLAEAKFKPKHTGPVFVEVDTSKIKKKSSWVLFYAYK